MVLLATGLFRSIPLKILSADTNPSRRKGRRSKHRLNLRAMEGKKKDFVFILRVNLWCGTLLCNIMPLLFRRYDFILSSVTDN